MKQGKQQETKKVFLPSFYFAGILLLVLCSCGGYSAGGSPTGAGNTLHQSDMRIDIGSLPQMQVNSSQEIRVVLHPINNVLLSDITLQSASLPSKNATVTSIPITTVGTPTASLSDAFGHGYTAFATAMLTAASPELFKITSEGTTGYSNKDQGQSLTQPSILWKWLVLAKQPGFQTLDLEIDVTWRSAQKPQQGPYSIGGQPIYLSVQEVVLTATSTPEQPSTPTSTRIVPTPPPPKPPSIDWPALLTALAALLTAIATVLGAINHFKPGRIKKDDPS